MRSIMPWSGTASGVSKSREIDALRERFESLTPREQEVLPRVISGLLNKQIAAEIGTTEATLKVHRSQLMRKMRAQSIADLMRMAERIGIPVRRVLNLGKARNCEGVAQPYERPIESSALHA